MFKKIFTFFVLIATTLTASASLKLTMESKALTPGTTVQIPIYFWTDEDVVGLATEVETTGGLVVASMNRGEIIKNSKEWRLDIEFPDGNMVLLNNNVDDIQLCNGEIFILNVEVPEDFTEGEIKLVNSYGTPPDWSSDLDFDDTIVKFTAKTSDKPELYCNEVVLEAGKTNQVVPIYFKANQVLFGLQTTIKASKGINIISLSLGSIVSNTSEWLLNSDLPDEPMVFLNNKKDGISLGNGEIFRLTVSVDENCKTGEIYLTDNVATRPDDEYEVADVDMDDVTVPVTITSSTAINTANIATAASYYNANGQLISGKQHGLNIIRMADGSVKKAIIK